MSIAHLADSPCLVGQEPDRAAPMQMWWMYAAILSFAYELPLIELTVMDRVNPRLFDVVTVAALLILPGLQRHNMAPKFFRIWAWIVVLFALFALAWQVWLPWYWGKYSLWFAFKYLQGLFIVHLFLRIPLAEDQKRKLWTCTIIGGMIVALYAVPEYLRGGSSGELQLVSGTDNITYLQTGTLLSCLGRLYFHVAMFSALASVMALARCHTATSSQARVGTFLLGIFISWPAFFSGCRTGAIATLIGWMSLALQSSARAKIVIILLLAFFLAPLVLLGTSVLPLEAVTNVSPTLKRFIGAEAKGGQDTVAARLGLLTFPFELYSWQGWRLPLIGGGFYVVPHTYPDGLIRFRATYGIHNSYLFAFEQGGVVVLLLFLAFLVVLGRSLKNTVRYPANDTDLAFAKGMRAFFHALLFAMIPGQIFWQGFGSENFNGYIILLFVLATKRTTCDMLKFSDPKDYKRVLAMTGTAPR